MALVFSRHVLDAFGDGPCSLLSDNYEKAAALRVDVVLRDRHGVPSPKLKIPYLARSFSQASLRRCLELTEATVLALNAKLFAPPFVTARAAFENACNVMDVEHHLRDLRDPLRENEPTHDEISRTERFLRTKAFGVFDKLARSATVRRTGKELPKCENIYRAIIKRVHAYRQQEGIPYDLDFDRLYAFLCEFTHPQFYAVLAAYVAPDSDGERVPMVDAWTARQFHLGRAFEATQQALGLTVVAVSSLDLMMPFIIRACEMDLHKCGDWPSDVPYPWADDATSVKTLKDMAARGGGVSRCDS